MPKWSIDRSCTVEMIDNGEELTLNCQDLFEFIKQLLSTQGVYAKFKNKYGNYALEFKDYKNNDVIVKRIFYTSTGELVYDNSFEKPFISQLLYICFMHNMSGFSQVVVKAT